MRREDRGGGGPTRLVKDWGARPQLLCDGRGLAGSGLLVAFLRLGAGPGGGTWLVWPSLGGGQELSPAGLCWGAVAWGGQQTVLSAHSLFIGMLKKPLFCH